MKKLLIFALSLLLFLTVFSMAASADGEREYLITKDGELFTLSRYESGEPVRVASADSLSQILTELSREGEGVRAVLDSVSEAGDLSLPRGSYTLSGTLTLRGILSVPDGAEVSLSSLALSFSGGGYLFVRGGRVSVYSSEISADGERAVLLNFSSRSSFELVSGEISGSFAEAAVTVKSGSLSLLGGSIANSGGVGVLSDTGLTLSGEPCISGVGADIKTSEEILLSEGERCYSGEVTVAYDGLFEEGTLTPLFYAASAEAVSGIKLVDRLGKEYVLSYFAESQHISEKNFAAVYLPYSLKYFVNDGLYRTEYYISGESPTLAPLPEREGYASVGWFSENAERAYEPTPIYSDLSLYSRYELMSPTFSLSSQSFTYDGEARQLSFDSLEHPLLDKGAYLTYEWKKEGKTVSSAPAYPIVGVSDSGKYSVTLTFHFGGESVSVTAENIEATVIAKRVPIPEIPRAAYTGNRLYPSVLPSSLYTYTATYGIGAGSYPVIFTLTDTENYRWEGTDEDTANADFVIEKAENAWVEAPKISDAYLGEAPIAQGKPLFGEMRVLYSENKLGPYTDILPGIAGEYYARLYADGTSDYSSVVSEPLKFKISEDTVTSLRIESYAKQSEYFAFSHFSLDGLVLKATYKSGREELVGNDKIKISYNGRDSLWVADKAVTLSYGGCLVSHPVSVLPIEYDLSGIVFSDTELVYDGGYHTANATLPEIIGLDGIPLVYTVTGGGRDAGSYGVTLSFRTDSKNYKLPEARYATLSVLPLSVTLTWSNTSHTYDGTAKLPTAAYNDVYGVKHYPPVTGVRYGAGEGYIATAAPDSQNYAFTNPECEFSIAKADYDVSGAYWSDSSFNYNGTAHRVELCGLPSGVRVVGYTDARHTDAGIYTARATVEYDRENYNEPNISSHTWVIYPSEYDTSGFSFSDSEAVYDGEVHYPTLVGSMPTGLDGISLSYSFSVGATHVSEGRVPVTVVFFTESKNYVVPSPLTAYVTVVAQGISVSWQGDEFVYDGKAKLPRAESAACAVRVTGEMTNAGVYTALCESLNPDFCILNPEYQFTIKKAENSWQNAPSVDNIYEGDELSFSGDSLFGRVLFKFFYDENMLREVDLPMLPGRYYAIAYVPESENYLLIESEALSFEIIKLVPSALELTLADRPYPALSTLTEESLLAYITYNSGKRQALDFSSLTVEYQSGSTLRFGDTQVKVSYLGFVKTLPVSVVRRNYDLSEVRWQNTDTVYDGEMKCPTLTGLPLGISVDSYEGYGTEAGEYTVKANLSYDRQNYNPPSIPDATLVIRRCTLWPVLLPVTYDGTLHIPKSNSDLYSVVNPESVRDAGSYAVTVRIGDTKNYTFESGKEALVSFTVLPRVLEIDFSDVFVYLFESDYEFTLTAPVDTVSDGEVEILGKIEGERVVYSLSNPNYKLSSGIGRAVRLPYPSPRVSWIILFVFLLLLLLTLLFLVIVYRYDSIKGAIAAVRCKRKMRIILKNEKTEKKELLSAQMPFEDEPPKEPALPEPKPKSAESEICDAALSVDAERADELITDSLAKDLLKRRREFVYTEGSKRGVINVDTLSESFPSGESVDVNVLKEKRLIPYDTAYLKVLARGTIDKPLTVRANDFSLAAIKMIALSGGEAVKVVTVKKKRER